LQLKSASKQPGPVSKQLRAEIIPSQTCFKAAQTGVNPAFGCNKKAENRRQKARKHEGDSDN
jgi:hypothetical protein